MRFISKVIVLFAAILAVLSYPVPLNGRDLVKRQSTGTSSSSGTTASFHSVNGSGTGTGHHAAISQGKAPPGSLAGHGRAVHDQLETYVE